MRPFLGPLGAPDGGARLLSALLGNPVLPRSGQRLVVVGRRRTDVLAEHLGYGESGRGPWYESPDEGPERLELPSVGSRLRLSPVLRNRRKGPRREARSPPETSSWHEKEGVGEFWLVSAAKANNAEKLPRNDSFFPTRETTRSSRSSTRGRNTGLLRRQQTAGRPDERRCTARGAYIRSRCSRDWT